jgi:pyruvate kinase
MKAGMDVARLNFSHGTPTAHARVIRAIRRLSRSLRRPVAIIADLPGPKIRTGRLQGGGPVELKRNRTIVITTSGGRGSAARLVINHRKLAEDVRPGDRILLSDGLIELRVRSVSKGEVHCRVVNGGTLGELKGVNLPGVQLSAPSLTRADRSLALFAARHRVDYIAQSFVRSASDVRRLKSLLRRAGSDIPVVAKIEKPEALDHLEEILDTADGVMVARGDLGVEMRPEKVPAAQKRIIRLANERRRPVITATQMLESMIENPRPTRAEASDVANAVLDGTDALMLSGETATGRHPEGAVSMMARIIAEAEAIASERPHPWKHGAADIALTVAEAASLAAERLPVRAIVVFTESGFTARLVSKARPSPAIVAYSPSRAVRRRLPLLWGVTPYPLRRVREIDALAVEAERDLLRRRLASKGDLIVLVAGTPLHTAGSTNLLKLHTVGG